VKELKKIYLKFSKKKHKLLEPVKRIEWIKSEGITSMKI